MTESETLTVVVEREIAASPATLWRVLTQPALIAEWLMQNDFKPVVGHKFKFTADWGAVDGEVLAVEPNEKLAYSWGAYGLASVVTFTLTPAGSGTLLRMEQAGFKADQPQFYEGAKSGWQGFFAKLEQVAARAG